MSWKAVGIIFMSLFILETILVVWFMMIGLQSVENEEICAYDICADYPSFYYDWVDETCSCFDKTGEAAYFEWMKNGN